MRDAEVPGAKQERQEEDHVPGERAQHGVAAHGLAHHGAHVAEESPPAAARPAGCPVGRGRLARGVAVRARIGSRRQGGGLVGQGVAVPRTGSVGPASGVRGPGESATIVRIKIKVGLARGPGVWSGRMPCGPLVVGGGVRRGPGS